MIFRKILLVLFVVAINIFGIEPSFGQQPDPVTMDSVSIVNNQVYLSWLPNNDNTDRYVIYRFTWNGTYFIWDSISQNIGINNTLFIDQAINACDSSYTYKVLAKTADGSSSNFQDTKLVRTMFLVPPKLDICGNLAEIDWTSYLNISPSFGKYYILADTTNDGIESFFKIDSTSSVGETNYIHRNLAANTTYTYMIRAISSDGTKSSSSCKRTISSQTLKLPDSVYLRYATVEDFDHVKLEWTVGNDAKISKFKILRSTDGMTFDTIEEINHTGDFNPSTQFIDTSADFNAQSYYYKIRVCDSCGADMLASENFARTVHLSGIPGITGNENELSWNHYKDWDFGGSGIGSYQIYRLVNGTPNQDGIDNPLFASLTSYTDDVSGFSTSEGVFNYYIVAYEKDIDNGFETFKDSSVSNKIEIKQETRVILPNAFGPDLPYPDNVFKPILAFINTEGYSLSIFNKWGQLIFITEDPTQGWDGKFKGEYVPSDAYVYQLKYKTPQGQNLEKRGTVTVIR